MTQARNSRVLIKKFLPEVIFNLQESKAPTSRQGRKKELTGVATRGYIYHNLFYFIAYFVPGLDKLLDISLRTAVYDNTV